MCLGSASRPTIRRLLKGGVACTAVRRNGMREHGGLRESSRDDFVRILMRNVTSLHQLLDDVTSLARLQAGREVRHSEPSDITMIMQQLCEGIRPLFALRRTCGIGGRCRLSQGAADCAKNEILNAVKYSREGGITVRWDDSAANDPKRWELCIVETGPRFHADSSKPIAERPSRK